MGYVVLSTAGAPSVSQFTVSKVEVKVISIPLVSVCVPLGKISCHFLSSKNIGK